MAWYDTLWAGMKYSNPYAMITGKTSRAIKNAAERSAGQVALGGSIWDTLKAAARPQTVYAKENNVGALDYTQSNNNINNAMLPQVQGASTTAESTPITTNTTGGGTAPAPAPEPTFEAYYNGVYYTDPEAYQKAVQDDLLKNYNDQKATLDRQYDSGLITYDQRQTALDKARKTSMQQIQGYFGAVSPEAYQSVQGGMEGEAQNVYQQNTTNLGREKTDYTANVLDNIKSLQDDYQQKVDYLANQLTELNPTNPELISNYTGNVSAPTQETPQEVLDQFGKFDLTKQMYGGALPATKKFSSKAATKKPVNPLTAALYPDAVSAYM